MISVICLNSKNDLEVIVASRLGYERESKRFYFEMMGCPVVYYYENVPAELAGSAIKTALKQGGASLKEFGPYKVQMPEKPIAPPPPVVSAKAARPEHAGNAPRPERACPKAAEGKVGPPARRPRETLNRDDNVPSKPSFVDKMGKIVDDGMKKIKSTMQEVAVVAEEESKKDKERSEARKAEWNKKKSELEAAAEERRARRAAVRASLEEDDEDDDEIRSEFDAIAQSVAAAAEQSVEREISTPIEHVEHLATSFEDEQMVAEHVASVMAEKTSAEPKNPDDELKEITQLNLDFGNIDDIMDDIVG